MKPPVQYLKYFKVITDAKIKLFFERETDALHLNKFRILLLSKMTQVKATT